MKEVDGPYTRAIARTKAMAALLAAARESRLQEAMVETAHALEGNVFAQEFARELSQVVQGTRPLPQLVARADVLSDPEGAPIPDTPLAQVMTLMSLFYNATDGTVANGVCAYTQRMPREAGLLLVYTVLKETGIARMCVFTDNQSFWKLAKHVLKGE